MSAVLGIFNFDGRVESDAVVQGMLAGMRARGDEHVQVWRDAGVTLAVARFGWETDTGLSGPSLVVEQGDLVVAADASLYYRERLLGRLAGGAVRTPNPTASELILAAYRTWGPELARELEGDFAFLVWDRHSRRVVCARDHSGVRPLFHAEFGETLVVASTLGGVIAHPRCPDELDLANVALDAAGIVFAYSNATCYRAVHAHPAGATTTWAGAGRKHSDRWWDPGVSQAGPRDISQAAEQLREILGEAVAARVQEDAPNALWLSGGWDSTAVFAAGRHRLGTRGGAIHPVSMSYPPGDSGREDETIQAVVDHWNSPVRWVDGSAAPLIEVSPGYARPRHEPVPFYFEKWMRYLAQQTRATGARVVLTGHGGNFLFASSEVFLADLLATGRLLTLRREWRALRVPRGQRARNLFRWAVQPLLPPAVISLLERSRGRPLLGIYERPLPDWMAGSFAARHGVVERARAATPQAPRGSRSGYELEWFMTHPLFPRLNALSFEATLADGVEQRAALYDPRLIRFVAAGPWSERFSNAGTKRLLRRAMHGLLPDSVLADRFGRRDGTLATYVQNSMRHVRPSLRRMLEDPILAELGIVDAAALKRDLDRYERGRGHRFLEEQLLSAAHVESWLRARAGVATPVAAGRMEPVESGALSVGPV